MATANLFFFSELTRRKLRPQQAPCWCFAMTSACKYPQLTQAKFRACSKLVCEQFGLACTPADKSRLDPCEVLTAACPPRGTAGSKNWSPVSCLQGFLERCDGSFTMFYIKIVFQFASHVFKHGVGFSYSNYLSIKSGASNHIYKKCPTIRGMLVMMLEVLN